VARAQEPETRPVDVIGAVIGISLLLALIALMPPAEGAGIWEQYEDE
jgi:hypothetical protein